ncbi:MAG: hypothetical protein ACR2QL_02055 [Woeseiaceae bacterium]
MDSRKVKDWVEIVATLSVFAGILLLVQEIRLNTRALAMQTQVNRSAVLTEPFYQSEQLRTAIQKVRNIDGVWELETTFTEQYDLTAEESLVLSRHLMQLWDMTEATYYYGDREAAEFYARVFLASRDSRLFVKHYGFDDEFDAYVRAVLAEYDDAADIQ